MQAATIPSELSGRLRKHEVEATALFVGSRIGAVHHYCAAVCDAELVGDAVRAAFTDFYETLEADRVEDARLEVALMRRVRLAAGERTGGDRRSGAGASDGVFGCELTPLVLVGSSKAPAGLEVLRQMRDHLGDCARCQATEARLIAAEAAFFAWREREVPEDVLRAVLDRVPPHAEMPAPQARLDGVADGDEVGRASSRAAQAPHADDTPAGVRLSLKQVVAAAALAAAVVIALVAVFAGGSSGAGGSASQERSDPPGRSRSPSPPAVSRRERAAAAPGALAGAKVSDFDPHGGNGERPGQVRNVIDGNPATRWETELYPAGAFGQGVGVYIALERPQRLRGVRIHTSTPGWDAEIYAASDGPPQQLTSPGWTMVGSKSRVRGVEAISLVQDPKPIRYCLVWVRRLPPGARLASIAEISLLARR